MRHVASPVYTIGVIVLAYLPQHLDAQSASVTGTVLIDATNKPLANAEVALANLKLATRSDSAGNFALTSLPAGKHSLVIRLPGYQVLTADVTLGATQRIDAEYVLTPTTTKLKKVDVKAKAIGPYAAKLMEFEDRRHAGIGKFLTADVFEKEDGRPPSSFLRKYISGLNIIASGGRHWLASGRNGGNCGSVFRACSPDKPPTMEKIPPACYAKIIVDGRIEFDGDMDHQELFDIDRLNAKDIIGMEYHTNANMPTQFNGTSKKYGTCGAVIIWTKGG